MAYAKGTSTPINPDKKTNRVNRARVGTTKTVVTPASVGPKGRLEVRMPVARKPARNKARVAP